jgi:ribokinase
MPSSLPASPPSHDARRHIVCLGDIMIDIVAELPGPLALGSDVHASIRYLPGGSAANTAVWLAGAGAPVTLIGLVGNDAMGAQAHFDFAEAGVIDHVGIDRERPTGTCIVLVTPDGERTMIPDPGANGALAAEQLDADDFTADGHLHVSGYALLGDARPGAVAALERARTARMTVSVDAASAAPLAAAGADEFAALIGTDLLLFANAAEAAVLTGHEDPASAAQALSARFGYAVVKAGSDGAYWSDGTDQVLHGPGHKLSQVVDTVGAGDAFAATFLSAISVGYDPQRALRDANQIAALACTLRGGRPPADLALLARESAWLE